MANPLPFKPKSVDPKLELQRRLDAAPQIHAEALLVAYDVLQAAHDQGLLDLLEGLVTGKDFIAAKVAEYLKLPEGIATIRNIIVAIKILGTINAETLDSLSRGIINASTRHAQEEKPPSLWQLARRATSEDSRRGLSLMTLVLSGMGRALKR